MAYAKTRQESCSQGTDRNASTDLMRSMKCHNSRASLEDLPLGALGQEGRPGNGALPALPTAANAAHRKGHR